MLCAVIAKSKISDIIDVAKKIEKIKGVNAIEFRLDYLNASEFKNFDKFFEIEKIKKIKIATCMLKNEGGNFKGSIDERNEILKKSENFCDYLTIEMKNFRDVFNSNLILSYHNFEKCPEKNEIEKISSKDEDLKLNVSIGISSYPDKIKNPNLLIKSCEEFLSLAKKNRSKIEYKK